MLPVSGGLFQKYREPDEKLIRVAKKLCVVSDVVISFQVFGYHLIFDALELTYCFIRQVFKARQEINALTAIYKKK